MKNQRAWGNNQESIPDLGAFYLGCGISNKPLFKSFGKRISTVVIRKDQFGLIPGYALKFPPQQLSSVKSDLLKRTAENFHGEKINVCDDPDFWSTARLFPKSLPEVRRSIQNGLSLEEVYFISGVLDLNNEQLQKVLGVSTRTLQRREKAGKRLSQEESTRLFRVQKVFSAALELFEGNIEAMRSWLKIPLPVLEGETPLGYADTDPGTQYVLEIIKRLEQGVFS